MNHKQATYLDAVLRQLNKGGSYMPQRQNELIEAIDPEESNLREVHWAIDFLIMHEFIRHINEVGYPRVLTPKGTEKIESGGFVAEYRSSTRINFWVIVGGIAAVIAALTGIITVIIELCRK